MPKHHKVSKLEQKIKNVVLKTQSKIEEHKFLDLVGNATLTLGATTSSFQALGQTNATTSASIINLCAIAQGVDINQRVGNEIKVLGVNLKSVVTNFGNFGDVRTMLIQDTQQISDTAPTITDIFSYWSPNQYLLNIANNKRFKILERSDIRWSFLTASTVASGANQMLTGGNQFPEMNIFHKFKYPLRIRYNGASSADVQKNALYLVVMGSKENRQDGSNNGSCDVPYMSRLKYIDG